MSSVAAQSAPVSAGSPSDAGDMYHVRIRRTSGWKAMDARELWRFRDLIFILGGRDLKVRYKQTMIGVLWVLLLPIFGAGILTFVFGLLAGVGEDSSVPAFVLTFCGMFGWHAFSRTLSKVSASLVANTQLVQKIYFPRLILPIAGTVGILIDLAVVGAMLGALLIAFRVWGGSAAAAAPLFLVLLLALGFGVGLILTALSVRFRDVQHLTPVALNFLLFASPVAYRVQDIADGAVSRDIDPGLASAIFHLNPLVSLLEGLRWSLLGTPEPEWGWVAYSACIATVLLVCGALVFRRMERSFADVI